MTVRFVWALAVVGAALALFFAQPELAPDAREQRFVTVTIALAAIALVLGSGRWLAHALQAPRDGAVRPSSAALPALLWPLVVLAWSLIVRFALTEPNILTDGGSGYGRLLTGVPRFLGLSVLVQMVMPASLEGMMWPSIYVPRTAAALTPMLLTVVARQLGAGWRVAVLAGVALASYPLHAAMFSSDFLAGASPAVALFGMALILAGRAEGGEGLFAAGALTLAYCIWIRPDAALAVAPAGLFVLMFPIRFWLRPMIIAPLGWLVGSVLVYGLTLGKVRQVLSGREVQLLGPWKDIPLGSFASDSAVLPWWLWMPVVPGALFLRGTMRWIALAGFLFGMASAHLGAPGDPMTKTWMEVFRYGAPAMPWMALLAAAGIVGLVDEACRAGASFVERSYPWEKIRHGWYAAAVVAVVATPLVNHEYVSRRYQNTPDEKAFLEAIRELPPECGLIVPDDEDVSGEAFVRYRKLVGEAVRRGEVRMDPQRIVGLGAFRRASTKLGRHPRFSEIEMKRFAVAPDGGPPCWYFYEGTYCSPGLPHYPAGRCREFLDTQAHTVVSTWIVEFWSHRLISRPHYRPPSLHDPHRVLALYRLD